MEGQGKSLGVVVGRTPVFTNDTGMQTAKEGVFFVVVGHSKYKKYCSIIAFI